MVHVLTESSAFSAALSADSCSVWDSISVDSGTELHETQLAAAGSGRLAENRQ